jgi:hypothetical protein
MLVSRQILQQACESGAAPSKQKHNNGVTKSCTNHNGADPSNYQGAAWLHAQHAPHRTLLPVTGSRVAWVCGSGVAKGASKL